MHHQKAVVRKYFGCNPSIIGPVVILTFSSKNLSHFKTLCSVSDEFGGWHKGFSGVFREGKITVINCGVGSSSIGDTTIALSNTPCKIILYSGAVGGLGEHMNIGDLFIPVEAMIGEGFSKYYQSIDESKPSEELLQFLLPEIREMSQEIGTLHLGKIFTTETLMMETEEFLRRIISKGCEGIDMETSAFYTASKYSGLKSLAVHYISDLPMKKSIFNDLGKSDLRNRERVKSKIPHFFLTLATKCYIHGGVKNFM
jgi:purine-nucleoside phosphorylase